MRRDHLLGLYDDEYARAYEEKFLLSDRTRSDTAHELALLEGFLTAGGSWLDVACGTGYFLRQFQEVERAGLDISPAMLQQARKGNPWIPLVLHDFRESLPAWEGSWDLVSCMWYAYGLVDTVDEVHRVIHNLWSWTSRTGTCFVPLLDTRLITGVELPYRMPYSETSHVEITGIVWSYVEEDEQKVHLNQIAPNVEYMEESFGVYFERVETVRYPPAFPGWQGRPALVASGKRPLESLEMEDVHMAPEETRIDEIRGLFAAVDFVMLGPLNPGRDAETKARVGWVAPYGRKDNPTAITAAGQGPTAHDAAEDAWAQFEAEFGSPPGTSE